MPTFRELYEQEGLHWFPHFGTVLSGSSIFRNFVVPVGAEFAPVVDYDCGDGRRGVEMYLARYKGQPWFFCAVSGRELDDGFQRVFFDGYWVENYMWSGSHINRSMIRLEKDTGGIKKLSDVNWNVDWEHHYDDQEIATLDCSLEEVLPWIYGDPTISYFDGTLQCREINKDFAFFGVSEADIDEMRREQEERLRLHEEAR